MELNKYFFEALRLRLENILRALSNNRKAYIVYSNSISTDAKNIVHLNPRDQIESGVKADLVELLIFYKACVCHEGAHIRFTSLKDWKEACNRGPIFQHLVNIIEDGRIEAAIAEVLPGAGRWIKFTNQYIYNHRKPEAYGNGLKAFLMGLTTYSILKTIPPFLPAETQRLIKLAGPYVDIGRAAPATGETLQCAEQILLIPEIKALVDASTPPSMIEGNKGTKSPQKTTPSKETSERAEKALVIIQRRKLRKLPEDKSENPESKNPEKTPQKSSDKPNSEEKSNSDKEPDTDHEVPSGNNSPNNKTRELDEIQNDADESADNTDSDRNTSDESEKDCDKSEDEGCNKPEDNGSKLNDSVNEGCGKSESENSDESKSSDKSENSGYDDSGGDNSDTNESSDESVEISDEADNRDEFENDSENSDFDSTDNASDSENPAATSDKSGSPGQGNPVDAPVDIPPDTDEDFFSDPLEENFEELLEDSSKEIQSLTKDAENFEEEEKPLDIFEGIPLNIHGGIKLKEVIPKPRHAEYQKIKKHNEVLIKNLVNEIQVALETRKAYDLRSLNRGKLHAGSLWKIAVPDPSVFSRRIIPGDIPELAVYILVDLSGSMAGSNSWGGPTRISSVKNAACVISEACRELKIVHAVTGFHNVLGVRHEKAVTWEDPDSNKIASFDASGDNRDGFSIRIAVNELSFRTEPKKILFVLSDGQPSSVNGYAGQLAFNDVKQAVFEAKKKGIGVISIYFGDERSISAFKYMYDTPVFVSDLAILPRTLGEIFKKVYLE